MSASQHTPTPWKFISHDHNPNSEWLGNIQGSYGLDKEGIENIRTISCQTKYEIAPGEALANAAFIVRACNSHEALVEAAEWALKLRTESCANDEDAHERFEAIMDSLQAALKLTKS